MRSTPLGIALAALVIAAAGCSSSGKISVSAQSATAGDTSGTPGTLDLGNGIVISRVRLAVERVALEGEGAEADGGMAGADDGATHTLVADHGGSGGGGGDDGNDDADEAKVGPFLVDLTGDKLTNGISDVIDTDVKSGTFREIKIVIAPVAAADAGSVTGLADMNGQSVIVDGTFNAKTFSFQSTIHVKQKQESPITVSASSPANVTLKIDEKGWFTAADGKTALDPNDPASKPQIEDNIRRSVKAFCDHDHDGEDDAQEHHDGAGHH
jgi:hypothetical protein